MCVMPAKSVSQSFAPSHSSDGRPAVARTVNDKIMEKGEKGAVLHMTEPSWSGWQQRPN